MRFSHITLADKTLPIALHHLYVAMHQRGPSHRVRPILKKLNQEVPMSPLKTIALRLSSWRRTRDAVRELSQLSDRELSDIGIVRGDILSVARLAATAN